MLELLVAAALVALLTQMFVLVLVPLARSAGRNADRAELRNMVATAVDKLAADLDRGASDGISYRFDPTGAYPTVVAVQPLGDLTADGRPSWEPRLVVYVHDGARRKLLRKTWPPQPPGLSVTLSAGRTGKVGAADLLKLASQANGTETTLAGWVKNFSLEPEGSVVRVILEVERETQSYRLEVTEVLRNS